MRGCVIQVKPTRHAEGCKQHRAAPLQRSKAPAGLAQLM